MALAGRLPYFSAQAAQLPPMLVVAADPFGGWGNGDEVQWFRSYGDHGCAPGGRSATMRRLPRLPPSCGDPSSALVAASMPWHVGSAQGDE